MESLRIATPVENKVFWQSQIELQKSSGLTRAAYCRQKNLNYHRFGYWLYQENRATKQSAQLVSVKLKETIQLKPKPSSILCTLKLNNGHSLEIHDISTLSVILERMC
jgi:hypothetical protein